MTAPMWGQGMNGAPPGGPVVVAPRSGLAVAADKPPLAPPPPPPPAPSQALLPVDAPNARGQLVPAPPCAQGQGVPAPPAPPPGGLPPPMLQQMPMQGAVMQPGMMMPQAMAAQQMYMQQCMMMQPGQPGQANPDPGGSAGRDAKPAVVMTQEGQKKAAEYQRLMKKGDNAETVFIGGLRKTTDEDQVAAHFAKFGQVEKVEIKRQPDGTSRGFAFVRFKDLGAVDRVIEKRASHMIDNKWIDVKKHSGVAACAGRAASLTKDEPKDDDEEPDPDDLEEKWTSQYLTMAQQMQQNFGEPGGQDAAPPDAPKEPEPPPPPPAPQPMMAMCAPMGMQPMAMARPPPQEVGASQEPMVTGFMAVDPSVLGISGGPPGLMVGVPVLSNGQPAVSIPGMGPGMLMPQAGGGPGMPGSFGPAVGDGGARVGPFKPV